MKENLELVLSYIVFTIALIYGVLVFVRFNFQFTPDQMSHPGMVIAFLMSCMFNILKLVENTDSTRIHFASVFANTLTFLYAAAFAIQDPWIAKIVTTTIMGLIFLLSVDKLLRIVNRSRSASAV